MGTTQKASKAESPLSMLEVALLTHKKKNKDNNNISTELYIEFLLFPSNKSLNTGENLFRKSSGVWSLACKAEEEASKYARRKLISSL